MGGDSLCPEIQNTLALCLVVMRVDGCMFGSLLINVLDGVPKDDVDFNEHRIEVLLGHAK